ncbi:MAG: hypothetical protein E7634_06540 [Ruminococcaceae bacterium]|nr:hypothetical protein [Oscillospiraceae bacterium]
MISAENITKTKTFTDVNFSFEKGIMCILSPADKDKNELLTAISGQKALCSGSLTGEAVCGYVAKGAPLPSNLKVSEYIGFVMRAKGVPFFADELKEKLGDVYGRSVSSLSNLMRYKTAVIAELIYSPDVLLLEAPSFALTFEESEDIFAFIEELSAETPVIFTSERVSEARTYADHTLVLLNGKQLFFGSSENMIAETEKEGALTVKVKGDGEKVKAIFEKYGAEILQSVRKGTYKCVLSVSESEKTEIRNAVAANGLALLEMKSEGDDLKQLVTVLTEKENALRMAYEDEKAEAEIKTLNQLKDQLTFTHEEDNVYETDDDGDGDEDKNVSDEAPRKALSEEEKEKKRRALFGHSYESYDDDDDGESTLFSSKN